MCTHTAQVNVVIDTINDTIVIEISIWIERACSELATIARKQVVIIKNVQLVVIVNVTKFKYYTRFVHCRYRSGKTRE